MRSMEEQNGIKWANKLQGFLGSDYEIRYDYIDSGMTACFYKGQLYKQVENSQMTGSINVPDFRYVA